MKLTAEQCWNLSKGFWPDIWRAARSTGCPTELLLQFAFQDTDYKSKSLALRNPSFPVDSLEEYALSGREYYYEALMGKHLSGSFLKRIVERANKMWEENRRGEANYPHMGTEYPHPIYWVLCHPNCPEELLDLYALSPFEDLRVAIAGNPRIPEFAVDTLGRDRQLLVRLKLAGNKGLGAGTLADIASSEENVRVLVKLVGRLETADRAGVLANLSRLKQVRAQKVLARYSNDPEVLSLLCYSSSRAVRELASNNIAVRDEDKVAALLIG